MRFLLTSFLTLLLASASFAKDFEGRLDMMMKTGKQSTPMAYLIKPGHMRFESKPTPEVTSVGLIDASSGDMVILMQEQKMYMVISAKKVAEFTPDTTFEETGRKETIAGKTCSEFVVKDKKSSTEIWATDELGGIANLAQAFGRRGQRSAWENEMINRGLFALRVITKNKRGSEVSRMECVTITEEKLDDALFQIPEGYKKVPGLGDILGR